MKLNIILCILLLSLTACRKDATGTAAAPEPAVAVTLTHATRGTIAKEITMSATTAWLKKSVVSAPIAAFITSASVMPGMRVSAGQTLYRIVSKEQQALGSEGTDASIAVRAGHAGIVLEAFQQAGSFVAEGTQLCTIADAGSMVFEINMPYEQRRYARSGRCTIVLPDGTRLPAVVSTALATMNTAAQAEKVIARARAPFLPEGMNVEAVFRQAAKTAGNSLILPASAVMSDETLTSHWVMVLGADNRARRVAVETGNSNATQIEIKGGSITPADNVILTGGYGLEDGARVKVER